MTPFRPDQPPELPAGSDEDAAMAYAPTGEASPAPSAAEHTCRRHAAALMAIDGVTGVATGYSPTGDEAIIVYLREQAVATKVPRLLDGIPVVVEVTGEIDAQATRSAQD